MLAMLSFPPPQIMLNQICCAEDTYIPKPFLMYNIACVLCSVAP